MLHSLQILFGDVTLVDQPVRVLEKVVNLWIQYVYSFLQSLQK